jgi:hypothetical protein
MLLENGVVAGVAKFFAYPIVKVAEDVIVFSLMMLGENDSDCVRFHGAIN